MIEKGSMFKAWEATTEQQKKAHEMQPSTRPGNRPQAIQEAMTGNIKKRPAPAAWQKPKQTRSRNWKVGKP